MLGYELYDGGALFLTYFCQEHQQLENDTIIYMPIAPGIA
jgi:hypothetical protein